MPRNVYDPLSIIGAAKFLPSRDNTDWRAWILPSASALGEVVAVDVLRTDHKIFNLLALNHIALPPATPGWDETYPEFFVINQMLPVRFNKALFPGAGNDDGETFNLIVYVRLPPKLGLGWSADKEPCGAEELLKRCVWP